MLEDPDRADEIADEGLEDYAERKKIALANPRRKKNMARRIKTREELQEEIDDLKAENQGLQDQLDSIADIVAPTDEDEDEEEDADQD